MIEALAVDNAVMQFGGLRAVDGVSLTVATGERRALLGPNGAGKSTLFNMIGGQLRPSQGRIRLFGADMTTLKPSARARVGLARTFQITSLFAALSVEENIQLAVQALLPGRLGMLYAASAYRETVERVETLLADWRLAVGRSTVVADLSYGEQRKLEIAMALAHQPRLLLLDEPTAGLSTAETENVVALIRGLDRSITVIAIEHDMDVAFEIADRFTILHQGRILTEGSAADIRGNADVQSVYFGDAA
jgi:branched-chain amino acid transport system ATP-binding protein